MPAGVYTRMEPLAGADKAVPIMAMVQKGRHAVVAVRGSNTKHEWALSEWRLGVRAVALCVFKQLECKCCWTSGKGPITVSQQQQPCLVLGSRPSLCALANTLKYTHPPAHSNSHTTSHILPVRHLHAGSRRWAAKRKSNV